MENRSGEIIRKRRIELGITQETAALKLGMSIHQYQRYEYGEHTLEGCPMRIGLKICAFLKLDPFKAVFGDSEKIF